MKTNSSGSGGTAPLVFNLSVRLREVLNFTPLQLTPGKGPRCTLNRRLRGPQDLSWQFGQEKISCLYRDSKPGQVHSWSLCGLHYPASSKGTGRQMFTAGSMARWVLVGSDGEWVTLQRLPAFINPLLLSTFQCQIIFLKIEHSVLYRMHFLSSPWIVPLLIETSVCRKHFFLAFGRIFLCNWARTIAEVVPTQDNITQRIVISSCILHISMWNPEIISKNIYEFSSYFTEKCSPQLQRQIG